MKAADAPMFYSIVESPIGELLLTSDGAALTGLHMERPAGDRRLDSARSRSDGSADAALRAAREQLAAYFARELTEFDVPLAARGTAFQQRVWSALRSIPYGATASYGDIARRIESPAAVRAVGAANGQNPISIIVPCHRVIGTDGSLTGFGGGIERKQWLLAHEARVAPAVAHVSQPLTPTTSLPRRHHAGRDGGRATSG